MRHCSGFLFLSLLATQCKTPNGQSGLMDDFKPTERCEEGVPDTCPAGQECRELTIADTPQDVGRFFCQPSLNRHGVFEWRDADPAYLATAPGDYLVEFGHYVVEGNERGHVVIEEGNRVFVIYRSGLEKDVIDDFIKEPDGSSIFSHGVFLAKSSYNKAYSWIWRPTGVPPSDMAMEVCDGSPSFLEETATKRRVSGWSGVEVDGAKVPHVCFWNYAPIRVTKDGKELWKADGYRP